MLGVSCVMCQCKYCHVSCVMCHVMGHGSCIVPCVMHTCRMSLCMHVIGHRSRVMCHMSCPVHVIFHVYVTSHVSCVIFFMCHVSCVI
jgi:hypothetical protein